MLTRRKEAAVCLIFSSFSFNPVEAFFKIKDPRINKDITENVRILEETLEVSGSRESDPGQLRTYHYRYEMQPAPGVRSAKLSTWLTISP